MGTEDPRTVPREELLRLVPWLDELDPAHWHLVGYDTFSDEFYPLYVMDMSKVYFTNKTAA